MKITVAIPCYNLEDKITECLESVNTQDYQDIEVLVIDDCSTDNSVEVINDYIQYHPHRDFHFIINEKNLGLNIVRNIAIREARGEALFFVDGDDTIEPGTISLFHQKMEETDAEVVCGSFRKTDSNGNTILEKRCPTYSYKGDFATSAYIENHFTPSLGNFPNAVWNKLYRLSFLRQHHISCHEEHRYHEDNYFSLQVALHAKSVAFMDVITYNYIQVPTSICNRKLDSIHCESIYAVMASVFDTYADLKASLNGKQVPQGVLYFLNMILLTGGMLYIFYTSEISQVEKKEFLKWLRNHYRQNNIRWKQVVGIYNKISYAILVSPTPYLLFHYYFKNLKTINKMLNSFCPKHN